MCIGSSVGFGCTNAREDVKIVQILLNMNQVQPPLEVDGLYGKNTDRAIDWFQAKMGLERPSGRVDPEGETLKQLKKGIPAQWSGEKLAAIMPHATAERIALFAVPLITQMQAADIRTPLQ